MAALRRRNPAPNMHVEPFTLRFVFLCFRRNAQHVAVNLFSLHFMGPGIVRWLVPDLRSLPIEPKAKHPQVMMDGGAYVFSAQNGVHSLKGNGVRASASGDAHIAHRSSGGPWNGSWEYAGFKEIPCEHVSHGAGVGSGAAPRPSRQTAPCVRGVSR